MCLDLKLMRVDTINQTECLTFHQEEPWPSQKWKSHPSCDSQSSHFRRKHWFWFRSWGHKWEVCCWVLLPSSSFILLEGAISRLIPLCWLHQGQSCSRCGTSCLNRFNITIPLLLVLGLIAVAPSQRPIGLASRSVVHPDAGLVCLANVELVALCHLQKKFKRL